MKEPVKVKNEEWIDWIEKGFNMYAKAQESFNDDALTKTFEPIKKEVDGLSGISKIKFKSLVLGVFLFRFGRSKNES
ncbi:hypothetical protein [Enterococcus pallens]|uniref:Uncharacterized protein n=1 Tax=Enterococcus pallens ATCC BAA-351 TaxID=1158607 RepID=R2SEV9_9ENTE|nr:hypothetical protein [Enterococcus pallens]EOH86724.1 hypothetical protein UAU_05170 [Enterococcus pallens ATCC BAA-351]EOU18520.1 hypothetical protein I588_03515 [Enterococcus pallens ATCC BAA-351]OJG76538.1 hypothetical protein RV10_GL003675 [Enterococcus pallens]